MKVFNLKYPIFEYELSKTIKKGRTNPAFFY